MAKGKVTAEAETSVKAKKTTSTKTTKAVAAKPAPKKSSKGVKKAGSKTAKKKVVAKTPKAKGAGKRYFKMIDESGNTIGRYTGETPKQAGSKAFTKLVQRTKKEGGKVPKKINIYLRESTRRSNRKTYGYVASRRQLEEPQELEIQDATTGETKRITYYYRNDIKKIAVPESMQGGAKKGKKATKKAGSKAKKAGSKTAKKGPAKSKKATKKAASPSKAKKAGGSKTAKKAAPKKKVAKGGAKATKSA
jgi:hypothetical protein